MTDSYKDLSKTMDKIIEDLKEIKRLNEEQRDNLNKMFGGKIF